MKDNQASEEGQGEELVLSTTAKDFVSNVLGFDSDESDNEDKDSEPELEKNRPSRLALGAKFVAHTQANSNNKTEQRIKSQLKGQKRQESSDEGSGSEGDESEEEALRKGETISAKKRSKVVDVFEMVESATQQKKRRKDIHRSSLPIDKNNKTHSKKASGGLNPTADPFTQGDDGFASNWDQDEDFSKEKNTKKDIESNAFFLDKAGLAADPFKTRIDPFKDGAEGLGFGLEQGSSTVTNDDNEQSKKVKRKRPKKRSRQKNIRKDNRPESEKPNSKRLTPKTQTYFENKKQQKQQKQES